MMTPDLSVQEAIRGLLGLLRRLGTLRQVMLWYHHEHILFPTMRNARGAQRVEWQLPNYQNLMRLV